MTSAQEQLDFDAWAEDADAPIDRIAGEGGPQRRVQAAAVDVDVHLGQVEHPHGDEQQRLAHEIEAVAARD